MTRRHAITAVYLAGAALLAWGALGMLRQASDGAQDWCAHDWQELASTYCPMAE